MTAFGKAHFASCGSEFYLEIYSVNKRNLDVSVYVPKEVMRLEYPIRSWMQALARRGSIVIKLIKEGRLDEEIKGIDLGHLEQLKRALDEYAHQLNLAPVESIEFLAQFAMEKPTAQKGIDYEVFLSDLKKAFDCATKEWQAMKSSEGTFLATDLKTRLSTLLKYVIEIEGRVKNAPEHFAKKLRSRLDEAGILQNQDDERVLKEIILFSDKIDVTEELIRLKSHLKQFQELLESAEEPKGRKCDFLIQEMNREVNSLGVKCQDIEIIQYVLEMKSELEKVREQVQNIE